MKKTGIVMIAVSMLLLCGCSKGADQERQASLRELGIQQEQNAQYDDALASFDQALDLSPMRVGKTELDIASYKASTLYHAGRNQEALEMCDAILDLKKIKDVYIMRGLIRKAEGDMNGAVQDFETAKEMTSSKDKIGLGKLAYYMEDYASAKEYLEAAFEAGDTKARFWEAELYWQMGNEDYAVTLYQSYLAQEPGEQSAYQKVAVYQMNQGRFDQALSTLQSGIAQGEAGSLKALLSTEIAAYEYKGDFETAKEKMEAFLEKYPTDAEAAREYEFLRTRVEEADSDEAESTEEEEA